MGVACETMPSVEKDKEKLLTNIHKPVRSLSINNRIAKGTMYKGVNLDSLKPFW